MSDEAPAEKPAADAPIDLRETFRNQLIQGIGGWTGALITAIPTAVFIIVNLATTLRTAIIAAVASAFVLAGYRLVRKQSIQQAITGLVGVVVAAIIAARTGEARGYFLLGIWTSFIYAVPFAASILIRRPLVGVLWEFLDPTPAAEGQVPWHKRRPLLLAYTWATLAVTIVFLSRGIVQATLYHQKSDGWLGVARIAMGYPLFIAAVGFSFVVVGRAKRRLARGSSVGEHGTP